nr:MAG TPA: hypothetical protein [Caudoviricetes sp.]
MKNSIQWITRIQYIGTETLSIKHFLKKMRKKIWNYQKHYISNVMIV